MSGGSVGELTDRELEEQGAAAHATRNWVFLHGTAEQFQHHTDRMLALEQEYLRRFPKRTWQGSSQQAKVVDEATHLRQALHGLSVQITALLAAHGDVEPTTGEGVDALLARLSAAGGRLHKLELHQAARETGVAPADLAALYRGDHPLLRADKDERVLTDAGRERLGKQEAG